jgi:4-deoxy-L-threo-5-hexosulose-uronate ketol-isomerase
LVNHGELKADFFLQRREIGIINTGGNGRVYTDGVAHELGKLDCLYIGKGVKEVKFESVIAGEPALFYLLSAPAHRNARFNLCPKKKHCLLIWEAWKLPMKEPSTNTFMQMVLRVANW